MESIRLFQLIVVLLLVCVKPVFAIGAANHRVAVVPQLHNADCADISLNGDGWLLSRQSEVKSPQDLDLNGHWLPIKVPGNWYLQYPYLHGANWYRKAFDLDGDSDCAGRLVFDGVDYHATVWLNGHLVGQHTGYFASFGFDVSDALVKGTNHLFVLVDSPLEKAEDWSLRKTTIKGVLSHHDTRPGGAWSDRGQEGNTGGIWNSVMLHRFGDASLSSLRIVAKPQKGIDKPSIEHTGKWKVAATANVSQYSAAATHVQLTLQRLPKEHYGALVAPAVEIDSKQAHLSLEMAVDNPALWYPHGHGDATLYEVSVTVLAGEKVLQTLSEEFGFRTVTYLEESEALLINGRRLFVRGTNYISHQWLSSMGESQYQRDIDLMLAAHINAVRVHAHVERREFYRLADRAGLLIWQDFPLQWGYSDTPAFHSSARSQLVEMLNELGNHASIVNWTLQNEPPFDAFWMKWKYPDYEPQQNQQMLDVLYDLARQTDDSRWLLKFSATNTHPWLGWYSGQWRDYGKPSRSRWVTEFGAQALPGLDSLKKIFFTRDLWPTDESSWAVWKYRNFQPRETFEIASVEQGENIQEFIYNTQVYQALVTGFAARELRLQKYRGVNGLFQFMFTENWPSINWGAVDFWRQPKAGYFALQQAYQPVMAMIQWQENEFVMGQSIEFPVWLINDSWQDLAAVQLTLSLFAQEREIDRFERDVELGADSLEQLFVYSPMGLSAGAFELRAALRDSAGNLLSRDKFEFKVDQGEVFSVLQEQHP